MKHVNIKMVLGLAISMIFFIGAFAAPVSALEVNIKIEKNNQGFRSSANNHTYLYVEPGPLNLLSRSTMHLNEDLDYTIYRYDNSGWTSPDDSLTEDINIPFNWFSFSEWNAGPFDNAVDMPLFYDFTASDGSEHVVNTTLETRTFGLTFGQHTAVLADIGFMYIGTLGISGQDFVHLTVESKQDDVSWTVVILDPEGRLLIQYGGSEGDIATLPFKPSIAGTYYVLLQANPTSGTFALFDFLPEAIAPTNLPLGQVASGTLTAAEIVVDPGTGSFVQKEMAPTTHTYVVNSPNDAGTISYAFNYGGLFDTQIEFIMFTSGDFTHSSNGGTRYFESHVMPTNGEYSYLGGPYYITVMGGDNTEYTLYNRVSEYGNLPVNHEFQFENHMGTTVTHAYKLDVEEPSLLRVNSTATGGELYMSLTGVYEDGYRVERTLAFGANMLSSSEYYLPVGEYFVLMDISDGVNEWVEFNMGSIVSDTTTQIVDIGGFFVDTEIFQMYDMTIFLNNQDNVTVGLDVTIYDTSGSVQYDAGMVLANRWDGSQIQPHPIYWANDTFSYNGQDWYDGQAFVGICAYLVDNNTQGATNNYQDYPVDLTIQWVSTLNDYYLNIENMDVVPSAAAYNFSLPATGITNERHALMLNTTPGTWYSVSVLSGAVTDFDAILFSAYDGRTHQTPWNDIDDAIAGTLYGNFSFQFGAISDSLFLELVIVRSASVDGFLWVQITPMETHSLLVEPITPLGPDILAFLGAIAVPAAIGVGVIVVVYIVYVKRFKK